MELGELSEPLLWRGSTGEEARGIGENGSELDHRERQRDEYVCMA